MCDTKFAMGFLKTNVLCVSIFVVACNITVSVGISWTKFNYESYFSGFTCVPDETLFQTEDIGNPITCGKLCDTNRHCLSAVYHPENHQCIGCRVNLYGANYDALPGSMYFSSKICEMAEHQRVCYYDNEASRRPGEGRFTPDNIDAKLCTHIIYSDADVNSSEIVTVARNDEENFQKLQKLKVESPCLKTLIAVGNLEYSRPTGREFAAMVANRETRQKFVYSVLSFLRKHGFNGLHVEWEYPGKDENKNLVHLVQPSRLWKISFHDMTGNQEFTSGIISEIIKMEMKSAFDADGYMLTAALPAITRIVDEGFDVIHLVKHLDFINLATYDNYDSSHITRGTSPLSANGQDIGQNHLDMKQSAYLISKDVPKMKLVIGIGVFGRTLTIENEGDNTIGAPATHGGRPGQFTDRWGELSYYEVCLLQESINANVHWSAEQTFPYFVDGTLWVGYENVRSITEKVTWVKEEGFAGAMMLSLDLDDFRMMCKSSKRPYPLVSVMYDILTSG